MKKKDLIALIYETLLEHEKLAKELYIVEGNPIYSLYHRIQGSRICFEKLMENCDEFKTKTK